MPELLLASASPRRREILRNLGFRFRVVKAPLVDEDAMLANNDQKPSDVAKALAVLKSKMLNLKPDEIALTADTIVVVGDEILGKPRDSSEAAKFLRKLSAKEHDVITAIVLRRGDTNRKPMICDFESTRVLFKRLTINDINWYVSSGEPFGKAGAYAIQGLGGVFIKRIDGCYFNVVGFPVFRLLDTMKRFGLDYRDFIISKGTEK